MNYNTNIQIKNVPHGTSRLIIFVFTKLRHLTVRRAGWIQFTSSHPVSWEILIFFTCTKPVSLTFYVACKLCDWYLARICNPWTRSIRSVHLSWLIWSAYYSDRTLFTDLFFCTFIFLQSLFFLDLMHYFLQNFQSKIPLEWLVS